MSGYTRSVYQAVPHKLLCSSLTERRKRGSQENSIKKNELHQKMLPTEMAQNKQGMWRRKKEKSVMGRSAKAGNDVLEAYFKWLDNPVQTEEFHIFKPSSKYRQHLTGRPSGDGQQVSLKSASKPTDGYHITDKCRSEESSSNDKLISTDNPYSSTRRLSSVQSANIDDQQPSGKIRNQRPLRLPVVLLPRLYAVSPRPLQYREFMTPTKLRGPITDEEWEDLKECRYIRQVVPRFESHQHQTSNLG